MHDEPTLPLGDSPHTSAGTPELRDTWGPFRLLARVGSGGFGELYRAWDPNLEREVALKLLLPGAVGGEEEYKAMLREARAMASVLHPNIVHVYGIDRHDGRVGFWTDFIKGKTLSALLGSQGPFGYREAALIGIDVSRALSAVHRAGLLHRDIKAENVMREEGGRILLMDFGLSAGERSIGGQIAGTPNYMAPEIFEGQAATVCSDIYAMGVLLYYLVIAEYPARLTGLTASEAKLALSRRTPLMDLRSDLPESFLRAVRTAMDLDPAKRFSSAGQLADALGESMGTGTVMSSAYTPVTGYTPASSSAPTASFAQTTPAPRTAAPPPPPPPPRVTEPPTWANLFGAAAWFAGLSRKKKWALFCLVVFLGQRAWEGLTPKHREKEPVSGTSAPATPKASDDDSTDEQDAQEMLRKAYKDANVASALKAFQQMIQDEPDSATAQAGLGSAYFKQYRANHDAKLLELAKTATNKALELDKDGKLAEPHVTMANIEAAEGHTSQAMLEVQKALGIDPKNAAAYAAMANVYAAEGKKTDALTAAKKAAELAPDEAEWPLLLGAHYSAAGDLKNATAQWQKSVSMDSDNAEGYANLGRANLSQDKLSDAREDFEKVTKIQPTSASCSALATTLILQGKFSDAVTAAKQATESGSLDHAAWGVLGRAQRLNGDRDDAAKSYAKAIDLGEGERMSTPDDPLLLVQLATYYAATDKSDVSVERVKRALAVARGNPDIAYRAGVVYMLLGQQGTAMPLILRPLAVGIDRTEIVHSPELAPLRSNVAVQALLAKDQGLRVTVTPPDLSGVPGINGVYVIPKPPVVPVAPNAPPR